MKKQIKTTHAITITTKVWQDCKKLGINISQTLEDYLTTLIKTDIELLKAISTCKLCNQEKNPNDIFKFDMPEDIKNKDGEDMSITLFICKDCFINVKNNKIKGYDKETLRIVQADIKNEQKDLDNNKNPDIIARVEAGEIRFQEPYEYNIGVYDGGNDWDVSKNSIKELIEDIKVNHPLARWKIEKGKISVPSLDIYPKN